MLISCLSPSRIALPDGESDALKVGSNAEQRSIRTDLAINFMFDSHAYSGKISLTFNRHEEHSLDVRNSQPELASSGLKRTLYRPRTQIQ